MRTVRRTTVHRDGLAAPRGVERYVLPGERVVLATRHHWGRLAEPVVTAVVVFLVVGWVVDAGGDAFAGPLQLLWWLWVVALLRVAWRLVEWRTEWFVATDKRMLLLHGLVTRKVAMMPLGKVTDMSYSRSVAGRLLGYGEFVLESAGQDQAMRNIPWVAHPDETYRELCATIFGQPYDRHGLPVQGGGVTPPAAGPSIGPWPRLPDAGDAPRDPALDTQPIIVPGRPATPDGPAWFVSEGGARFVALDPPDDAAR